MNTIYSKVSFVDVQSTREYFKMVRTLTIIVLDNTISIQLFITNVDLIFCSLSRLTVLLF